MRRGLLGGLALGSIVALGVGWLSGDAPSVAMAVAMVPAAIVIAIAAPGAVVAATLPAAFLTYRVGPQAFDMSIADFALIAAVVIALAGTTRLGGTTGALLRLVAVYQVVMFTIVAANPTDAAIVEWVHRAGLMAGGLVVGAAIVRHEMTAFAVRALLGTAGVFAVAAIGTTLSNGFAPAYPLGVHKNAAGSMLAMTIALVATIPDGWGVRARRSLYFLLGTGLFATQSRGAMVGLGAALLIWLLGERGTQRMKLLALGTALVGSLFVWNSVQNQIRSDPYGTGSIGIRERQQEQATAAFRTNTIRGAGIRYYDSRPKLARDGRPSSAVYETLGESGWIGLGALLIVVVGPVVVFRRRGSPWLAAALTVYGTKVVHGFFDNFWVAGPLTLPWLVIGIAAAIQLAPSGRADENEEAEEPALAHAQ